MNLNQICDQVHTANQKWWVDINTGQPLKRNKGEMLALIHSEISECDDGEVLGMMDDKLPHRPMGEVECVDAMIRTFDYAKGHGYELNSAAALLGAHDFLNLNCLAPAFSSFKHIAQDVSRRGISVLHSKISVVLELERKSRPAELIAHSLVELLVYIAVYAGQASYDIQGAFDEKMEYNAHREDHKHEARRIAGGKGF